jgi:DNA-directed RNA polymerase specialized sigma24 family protein
MNSAVSQYREAVEAIALRVSRGPVAIQVGAEYDDLVQEGLIQAWQTLERGMCPATDMLENRMRDYIRWLGTQVGRGRDGSVPYETLLPLDDFRSINEASAELDVDPLAGLDKGVQPAG